MKKFTFFLTASILFGTAALAIAAGPKLSVWGDVGGQTNRHNLSGDSRHTASVTYKAVYNPADRRSTEICIFCHTPHNASPATALWGRKSTVTSSFGFYTSNTLAIFKDPVSKTASNYGGEPNYASRLCLSCHDGATALGAVLNGPEIVFDVGKEKIAPSGYNTFNPNQGGNDATQHHHPISFKYNAEVRNAINTFETKTYKLPTENKTVGPPYYNFPDVKIDRNGYMQCTTCHNPHQNMSDSDATTPFWVLTNAKADVPPGGDGNGNVYDSVCLSCHPSDLLGFGNITSPYPY